MPVTVHAEVRRLTLNEFRDVAYVVVKHAFAVHNEFGRCFDERVYHHEIAGRCGGLVEVPIEVVHSTFRKRYFLDLLVAGGAVFEIKTVAALNKRHHNQLLNYLLLADLPRGKLINLRSASVRHEFVNAPLNLSDRTDFAIDDKSWSRTYPGAAVLQDECVALLRDLGTSLSVSLYEEALIHLLGGEDLVKRDVPILNDSEEIGAQRLPLASPQAIFRVTAMKDHARPRFITHLNRLLAHTQMQFLYWINVYRRKVTFTTIQT